MLFDELLRTHSVHWERPAYFIEGIASIIRVHFNNFLKLNWSAFIKNIILHLTYYSNVVILLTLHNFN